jgi:2',3'-cyclic-nucleotide 2'-phosphodiesterase (5'-nucleotidase family)
MTMTMIRLALLLALASAACAAPRELVVFHFNDAHGYVASTPDGRTQVGGMALLAGALERGRREAAARGAASITLFGGDMFQGTAVVEATKGACMVDLFNRMRLDAACLGNHEFDYGPQVLAERLAAAKFPFVGTNVKTSGPAAKHVKRTHLIARDGLKIGIAGCTTPQTPESGFPENTAGFAFAAPGDAVPPALDELKRAGATILIALTHDGVEDDRVLAGRARGLDLIVGGHSHTEIHQPVIAHGVPIVQAGEYTRWLGEVRLALSPQGRVTKLLGARLIRIVEPGVPRDAAIQKVVDSYVEPVDRAMREVVGDLAIDLPLGARGDESPIAAVVADAFREASGADIALVNKGGVRRGLERGPVTMGEVIEVVPFANTLVTMRLPGKTLRAMLEKSVSGQWVDPTPEFEALLVKNLPGRRLVSGKVPGLRTFGMLQGSGLSYAFDPRKPDGRRVVEALAGGRPLEDGRLYTVAVTNFLASGGDGFTELTTGTDVKRSTLKDREMLQRYLSRRRPLRRGPSGSLRNVSYKYAPLTAPAVAH